MPRVLLAALQPEVILTRTRRISERTATPGGQFYPSIFCWGPNRSVENPPTGIVACELNKAL